MGIVERGFEFSAWTTVLLKRLEFLEVVASLVKRGVYRRAGPQVVSVPQADAAIGDNIEEGADDRGGFAAAGPLPRAFHELVESRAWNRRIHTRGISLVGAVACRTDGRCIDSPAPLAAACRRGLRYTGATGPQCGARHRRDRRRAD